MGCFKNENPYGNFRLSVWEKYRNCQKLIE